MGAAGAPGLVRLDDRVEDLLARMTLPEKIAQLGGARFGRMLTGDDLDDDKLNAALADGVGHITCIATDSFAGPERTAAFANRIQRFLVERTRLGIPALLHEEAVAGLCAKGATQYPQAIGLASTWDPAPVEEVARSIRRHIMAVGARVALAPVVDIATDPAGAGWRRPTARTRSWPPGWRSPSYTASRATTSPPAWPPPPSTSWPTARPTTKPPSTGPCGGCWRRSSPSACSTTPTSMKLRRRWPSTRRPAGRWPGEPRPSRWSCSPTTARCRSRRTGEAPCSAPAADDRRLLLGDYNYPAHVEGVLGAPMDYVDMVTPLAGMRDAGLLVEHVAGVPLVGDADIAELESAVAAARAADVAWSASAACPG